MSIKRELRIMREKLRRRDGHKPGSVDASEAIEEVVFYLREPIFGGNGTVQQVRQPTFMARPNFYYFESCGRPCYLPLFPAPVRGGKDWAVTDGWPCEFRSRHNRSAGPHCYCDGPDQQGDWVQVIGQVRGQMTQNEIGQQSDIWNVVVLPVQHATRNVNYLQVIPLDSGLTRYYAFAPDMWLGNTGWRNMPFKPWWKLPSPPNSSRS